MDAFVIALLVIAVALDIAATLVVLRADAIPKQRRLQFVVLAWVIPIVGALLVLFLAMRAQARPRPQTANDTMAIDVLAAGPIDSTFGDRDRP